MCSKCHYTTLRPFNLKRHSRTHDKFDEPQRLRDEPQRLRAQEHTIPGKEPGNLCDKCNRSFKRKYNLTMHYDACEGIPKGCCDKCKKQFASKHQLCRHRKKCEVPEIPPEPEPTPPTMTINTVNNITNNTMNVNVNLLVYPKDDQEDQDFDFITEKITKSLLKKIGNMNPKVGFQRFIGSIFENPENRIVKKTNPSETTSESWRLIKTCSQRSHIT